MSPRRLFSLGVVAALLSLLPAAARASSAARSADRAIERRVLSALSSAPRLDVDRISVSVKDAEVTLTGHTRSIDDKLRETILALQVPGVRRVIDLVDTDWQQTMADEALTQEVHNRLRDDPTTSWIADDVHVRITDGALSLTGRVHTPVQREEAKLVAQRIKGVTRVDDRLRVDEDYTAWPLYDSSLEDEQNPPFL